MVLLESTRRLCSKTLLGGCGECAVLSGRRPGPYLPGGQASPHIVWSTAFSLHPSWRGLGLQVPTCQLVTAWSMRRKWNWGGPGCRGCPPSPPPLQGQAGTCGPPAGSPSPEAPPRGLPVSTSSSPSPDSPVLGAEFHRGEHLVLLIVCAGHPAGPFRLETQSWALGNLLGCFLDDFLPCGLSGAPIMQVPRGLAISLTSR